jgi:hypothetical protein
MNLNYHHLLNKNFNQKSKVWIYQSNRVFTLSEAIDLEEILQEFVKKWESHGIPIKGEAHLFFGQFIILIADETQTGVSGCSTDTSVRMIKEIENQFKVFLFDRTSLAFFVNDKIQLLPLSQLQYALDNRFITEETLYFNNLVQTKEELVSNWIIPVKNSWLSKQVSFSKPVL